ncbi:MAG: RNA-binding protein [Proteobacteria bacterium]|nr:RNA-binding protein [Pseudomonadota bacterium]MBU1709775.1 RNA-binding protein [Pseudomonadota bacterium]
MRMKIYVGNLSYEVTEEDLRLACEQFGQVESSTIIKDQFSGKSKGFGFVEMASKAEGQAAIDALNGKDLKGRAINVNEARPRTDKPKNKGGFGGGRGGQGSGRGGQGGDRGGYGGGRGGQGGDRGGQGGDRGGYGGRGGQGSGRGGQGGGRGGQGQG